MFVISIIGFIIVLLYVIYSTIKCKCIPESISASVYSLDEGKKWLFSCAMLLLGAMIAPYMFEMVPQAHEFIVWLMVMGLFGIAADPLRKNSKNIPHYIGAAVCGIASQALILLNCPSILLLWALYVPYTLVWEHSGKNMFFAELIMILGMMILCLI